MRTLCLASLLLTGCYASREPITPADAFQQPDAGPDAITFDAPPDAVVPNLGLGVDCTLGGTANAFALVPDSRGWLADGRSWREVSGDGWGVSADPASNVFVINTDPASANWSFAFGPGAGRELTPGEFEDAPGPEGPAAFQIYGDGRGGVETSGRFTVHEVAVRGDELLRLRVSFTFVDIYGADDRREEITGCIRYTAP